MYDSAPLWVVLDYPCIAKGTYKISEGGEFRHTYNDAPIEIYHSRNGHDFVMLILDPKFRNENPDLSKSPRMFFRVDMLVAYTFLKNKLDCEAIEIKHINGDLRDNSVANLEKIEAVEEWRTVTFGDIVRDKYEVSNFGKIRDKNTKEILHQRLDNYGYWMITLKLQHKTPGGYDSKPFKTHRLIANEWYGVDDADVNHIDGLPNNNYWTNLEYVTRSENVKHAVATGLQDVIPTKDIEMVYDLLAEHDRPKVVYDMIDHNQYPRISYSFVKAVKRGFYDHKVDMTHRKPLKKLFTQSVHKQPLKIEDIDYIRDCIRAHGNSCTAAYNDLDHNKYPTVNLSCVQAIKFGRSPYDKSIKYTRDELVDLKNSRTTKEFVAHYSKMDRETVDRIRTLLNENGGGITAVWNILNDPNITKFNIADVKDGANKQPSSIFDLSQNNGRYPFVKK